MGKVVNLRRARKAQTRNAARAEADANAARHGRSAAQREAEAGQAARAAKTLDAHKRDE